ncbi:hypothetical protein JL09_g6707 [Pichia kudriavzevii]|uniref:Uncharacterized protein n=1 Tax=Pichia kudriavzevii TaxID=4909 RepID=A0A099NJE0_PICKU|nr:hypothetical protein JL09_g6708 [Pichia kudriavzevii]KGK32686.1 hypothetical protein JL09_g6707 [Pichia kudriavzevii]
MGTKLLQMKDEHDHEIHP